MASNPPVEDQTDEDFFDKLVTGNADDNMGPTFPRFTESNDSDDARAFANLTTGEDSGSDGGGKEKDSDACPAPYNAHTGDDSNDSLVLDDSVDDSNNRGEEGAGSEAGSMNSGVMEVGWNSFYADSNENGVHGFGSYSDFFKDLGQFHDGDQVYRPSAADNGNEQDLNSSQYWETMYPGWKFDANTGQWYQVNGYEGSGGGNGVSYLQQSVQSVAGTMTTAENVACWNLASVQVNNGYPEHMFFDPQYPGWYYDTIAQEWRSLGSYNASVQGLDQQNQNGFALTGALSQNNSSGVYSGYGQGDNYGSQGLGSPGEHGNWGDSYGNYRSHGLNMWQPGTVAKAEAVSCFAGNQQFNTSFGSNMSINNHVNHSKSLYDSLQEVQSPNCANQVRTEANGGIGLRSFVPNVNFNHQFNQSNLNQNEQIHFSNDFYGGQNSVNVAQQQLQSSQLFPCASNTERTSAGRPPHALVTFGYGGKLIVMKDSRPLHNSSFGTQDTVGASISVLNLLEVVVGGTNGFPAASPACDYFHTLCQQSYPGPLVGGNVGSKELNKWIDDRIASCESPDMDYRKGEILRLLFSLFKIACQHYGKLRSPFGADTVLKDTDTPESAVAKLFASVKRKDTLHGALSICLHQLPSEGQIQATASEVQNLLVSGRKKEALQCAQDGQLWGPALVLASQLGDQFYFDTVKHMALRQLVAGSPLRTLCLLIAGQPAEVFSTDTTVYSMDMSQQHAQLGANCMLDDWEENLALITANRTKDDELVIIHLGDCLWKERSEITAAHICYLVAEANFEPYSDSARLCLIGADHWKFPRTYASPEAIQRTELYEYSKVLGNSQFILLPFQPYKLIYAHMLAEVGKVSDSLKYCQAVLKSLKTSRAPEVETWKQLVLSLEERARIHQQGGYATNLAPAKLVGKLLNFFDSTAHRVVGGLPPPAPSASNGNSQVNDHFHQQTGPRVSTSQSTMAMSSLMPSDSTEPISDWIGRGPDGKMTMHNRSVSEPDFGRTPRQGQVDSSKKPGASTTQGQGKDSAGASRFSPFGLLFQKTLGLVLKPRPDRQAKLGEKNKFYYDEKLKRWVEEGVEPPAEEAALAPPPTNAAFQNGISDCNLKSALKSEGSPTNGSPKFRNPTPIEHASGIPPIPTSSNQFSTRGRMGVRARYVDTFNKGGVGGQANSFQSPTVKPVKHAVAANAKFFIPAPSSNSEQTMEAITENATTDNHTKSNATKTFQRFPSMGNIDRKGSITINSNGVSPLSRRTVSWSSGSFADALSPPTPSKAEARPSSFIPAPMNATSGDDLHEVEL